MPRKDTFHGFGTFYALGNKLYTFDILVNNLTPINGATGDLSSQDVTFTVNSAVTVADNKHPSASLGDSEVLSVKNSIGEPIPEFPQRPKEGSKIPSVNPVAIIPICICPHCLEQG